MRVLLLFAALAVPAMPVAAQTKTGTSTATKSTTRAAKTTRPAAPAKSVAAIPPEPVIELPVDGKIVLGNIMKMRLRSLLIGSTMTYDDAVTGWRNRSQLVAAIDAASYRRLPFPAIHHEVTANNMFVVDAVAVVRGATAAPIALQ
jgi:hypothetical protein